MTIFLKEYNIMMFYCAKFIFIFISFLLVNSDLQC